MDPSFKSELLSNLPYLRRYARALAGEQKLADAIVLATLQSLSISLDRTRRAVRLDLYRRFSEIWNGPAGTHALSLAATSRGMPSSIEQKLAILSPLSRQAFLLSAMEGFGEADISAILSITSSRLSQLQSEARSEIIRQVATDVLIIEDEMFIASDLEDIMVSLGHRVVAIERTHSDAVRAIKHTSAGLILADIHLADGSSGISAVNEILLEWEVPVIFITAFPERLLTGLRPEPTFVLTKPFSEDSVRAVVSQALFFEVCAISGHGRREQPSVLAGQ